IDLSAGNKFAFDAGTDLVALARDVLPASEQPPISRPTTSLNSRKHTNTRSRVPRACGARFLVPRAT
ncbi:hypothetical protein, partial [Mycobacteroides abscessus]|uniref:hypothetical protein n=1 Tax=Mycobacteroides abscessus TaxID=36809 RepID=UPI001F27993E